MVDLDWQNNREDDYVDIDVANNPFEWASKLDVAGFSMPDGKRKGLFDAVDFWFFSVVHSTMRIKSRIKIEACIGDVSSVLEQIRYGIVGHRPLSDPAARNVEDDNSRTGDSGSSSPADNYP